MLNDELTYIQQQEDLEPVLRFTAVHAFLPGMQTGRELPVRARAANGRPYRAEAVQGSHTGEKWQALHVLAAI